MEASQVCPYIQGLQDIEGMSKLPKKTKLEPGGYCAAWGLFFAELNFKNPNLTSTEILDNIYNYLTTKESGPNYLKSVIRGYAGYIYKNVDRYLEIFFKPRVQLITLIGRDAFYRNYKRIDIVIDVMNVLIDLEMKIASDPTFDYHKELKSVMKAYKKQTQGKTKEEQREMRKKDKDLTNLYYKKRILQNYEEYKRDGHISEPVFDSPQDIRREDIKNLSIIEKGHLHELVAEEKQKRKEELEKQDWYIEKQRQKKEWQEQKKKSKKTVVKKRFTSIKNKKNTSNKSRCKFDRGYN